MRFLFECVACFNMTTQSSSSSTSSEEPSSPETITTMEETRSFVVRRRRKRKSTKGSSADWKPSLHVISEDNAAVLTTPNKVVNRKPVSQVVSSRNVKRCGPSSVQVNARSHSHDFSREPLPMVFPAAFSAAPFMF